MISEITTLPEPLRIDFGSGYNPKDGYKTCDITFAPNLDYVYDKDANVIINLEKASVDEFYAKNVLHHSNIERLVSCFYQYLKHKGIVTIIEPQVIYYEQNRCLDIFWYRYIYLRYEISIPPKKREDYTLCFKKYFKVKQHCTFDVYDIYVFEKDN